MRQIKIADGKPADKIIQNKKIYGKFEPVSFMGTRLTRVYYHIEESGVQHLAALKEDYFRTSLAIQKVLEHDFSMDEEDEQKDEQ